MKSMIDDWQRVENYSDEAINFLLKGNKKYDSDAKGIIESKIIPNYLKQIEVISQVEKSLQAQVDNAVSEAETSTKKTQTVLVSLGILSTISLILVGFIIASHLPNSLSKVTKEVHSAGSQVEMAGDQLSSASQALSSGATESASALEETVASLEELSSIVKMNADNAK